MDTLISGIESLSGSYLFAVIPALAYLLPSLLNIKIFTLVVACYLIYKWSFSYIKRKRCKKDTDEQIQVLAMKATMLYVLLSCLVLGSGMFDTLDTIVNNTIVWGIIGYYAFSKWMDFVITCNVQ